MGNKKSKSKSIKFNNNNINNDFLYKPSIPYVQYIDKHAEYKKDLLELNNLKLQKDVNYTKYFHTFMCKYISYSYEIDYDKELIKWLEIESIKGNKIAQFILGHIFKYRQGIKQDYKKAIEWYTKSATDTEFEKGDKYSQNTLAIMFEFG